MDELKGGEKIWIFGALCSHWCDVSFIFTLFWFLEIISGMDVFWKIGFWERQFLPIGFQEEKLSGDMRRIGNASWCVG